MFKAERIYPQYVESSTIEMQGNRQSIDRYLNQGYQIKESRNGYWVLTKPAKVIVTINCGKNGIFTHDMKNDIVENYKRSRISKNLVDTFKKDFKKGVFSLIADETGFLLTKIK